MKHKIKPTIDCVFKAMLGSNEHKNLLINFLNAVIAFKDGRKITNVKILNPYNERKYISDKLSIVDVKATCQNGYTYQIEVQLNVYPALKNRMVYNWSTIYKSQMEKGNTFSSLNPVFSIWITEKTMFPESKDYHFSFGIYDPIHKIYLTDHLQIDVLQLSLFKKTEESTINDKDRWLYLFKYGENHDIEKLPLILQTKEMRQAMEIVQGFSKSQEQYLLYESRLESQIEADTWQVMMDNAAKEVILEKENTIKILKKKDKVLEEKEKALKEKEKEKKKALEEKEKEKEIALEEKKKEKEIALKEQKKALEKKYLKLLNAK